MDITSESTLDSRRIPLYDTLTELAEINLTGIRAKSPPMIVRTPLPDTHASDGY
ncbi:hypothetical protein [Natronorubrum halophilum]|uniref:hypothetical protein n=1 Tax=Natronorubrum halophilum TaxID=1702106 RepID=UPI0013CE9FEE|nr:hypothetical protein [Natronorubrum halophilum]